MMKRLTAVLLATAFVAAAPQVSAQVAGHAALGVSVTELDAIIKGVSVKKQVLGKPVYNEANEKVGSVRDLIVTPENAVSFAVVGAGGFVGLGRHDVAIPVNQFKYDQGRIVLPGATKDAIKSMPEFQYERQEKPAKAR
jgi:sporulation protein YlmC with PRC-barrel domain